MTSRKLRIYFSDFFGVDPKVVSDYGAFNISLINDLPLFIDPFLLFNSEKLDYQQLHRDIIDYVVFLKSRSAEKLPSGLIKAWFHFPEIRQNWLGYSKTGNNGRGLGGDFARSLKRNLTSIFKDFGAEVGDGAHLEKLTLVKNGVGRDQISDFTCNLICGYLAEYTEQFALQHLPKNKTAKFNVSKIRFDKKTLTWTAKQFTLPKFGNQFVLLTPVDMLTKDESWISHRGLLEDYSEVLSSVDNDQLRAQVNQYFYQTLPIEATKTELGDTLEKVIERFPFVLDYYIKLKVADRSGAESHQTKRIGEAQDLFLDQCLQFAELLNETGFYDLPVSNFDEAIEKVKLMRDVLESADARSLFFSDGKPIARQDDALVMFRLVWLAASCVESDDGIVEEAGTGVGYGEGLDQFIQLKLAKNKKLEKILEAHAERLTDNEFSENPTITAILAFTSYELVKVTGLLTKYGLSGRRELILIDANQ